MSIASQVLILSVVVFIGVFCRRRSFFTDEVIRGVTQLVVNVTVPCLMITNMQRPFDAAVLVNFTITAVLGCLLIAGGMVAGHFIFLRRPRARRAVLSNIAAFTNCGFMGYPIIMAFNPDLMIYAVGYNIAYTVTAWTLGVMLFKGKEGLSLKRILLNPNIIAACIGIAIFLTGVKLPVILADSVSMLGGLTTPLTMLLIGTRVCGIKVSALKDPDYHLSALLRLVVFPLIVFALTAPLPLHESVKAVLFLLTAMPPATVIAMQAELYDGDAVFASRAIAYATLLSLVTVPVMGMLL
ncbi:MAG: AEC family transporter [Clostridia bacterium]|nr:AEC family transporter [Clostridia bacterium]